MKAAQSSGSRENSLLGLAVHASPSGLLIVDQNARIVFANATLLEMFGYSSEELLGQPVEFLIPKENAESHRRSRKSFARRPAPRDMGSGKYFEGQRKDGRRFPVEIGLRPSEIESEPMVVATVIDSSERKKIEDRLRRHENDLEQLVVERSGQLLLAQEEKERVMEQLIQAEKMAAIGTLTSGIGHEINNPLYAIMGTAEAIESENDLGLCQEYAQQILKHGRRIATTVKNFSGYAQPGGKHDLESVDLNECIEAVLFMAQRTLMNDNIAITQDVRTVAPILAKSEEIQQVLFNIVRNGIQAIDGTGSVHIQSRQQDQRAIVRIKDSGGGIDKAIQNKVFDPFFTTKGPDEGEGLGLYIVQQIVAKYGGTIELDNETESGTAFLIQFPLAK